MISRTLGSKLAALAQQFPAVTLTGPRQSGKTTLCRMVFPNHDYVSLEAPDMRRFAREDPRGFLEQFAAPVVIDEVQRVPDLLSYIQVAIDEEPTVGQFVLTGEPVAIMGAAQSGAEKRMNNPGPVLYIEFRKDGRPIDPGPWWSQNPGRAEG